MPGAKQAKQRKQERRAPAPVTVTVVHPDAMAEALRHAGGDRSRLRTLSANTVGVVNHGSLPWPGGKRVRAS